ncbi:hypothetical protein HY994_06760 [Candidatus Micrarchaeota archaeon]|nr:hypothetical protein [Candidatus Micrarchaeota archaeon]
MNAKIQQVLSPITAVLAIILGIAWILGGVGLRFAHEVSGPLTGGILGILVGAIFLIYGLQYFRVIK